MQIECAVTVLTYPHNLANTYEREKRKNNASFRTNGPGNLHMCKKHDIFGLSIIHKVLNTINATKAHLGCIQGTTATVR